MQQSWTAAAVLDWLGLIRPIRPVAPAGTSALVSGLQVLGAELLRSSLANCAPARGQRFAIAATGPLA